MRKKESEAKPLSLATQAARAEHRSILPASPLPQGTSPCPGLAAAAHHCRQLTHLQLHRSPAIIDSITTISL